MLGFKDFILLSQNIENTIGSLIINKHASQISMSKKHKILINHYKYRLKSLSPHYLPSTQIAVMICKLAVYKDLLKLLIHINIINGCQTPLAQQKN
jgi:hypothetical protein